MINLIRRIIREQLEGQGDNPLSEKEIRLFKFVNSRKEGLKTKSEYVDLFKTLMRLVSKPESDARFYYEIYIANYRPEGDYENLTKSNFKHYRDFKQRRTPNNTAYEYSSVKLPFKGSNLSGYWDINDNNQWYYVVESYGWYPIYLNIQDQWYRVSDTYSSSTSKHMSGSNPIRRKVYDENLKDTTIVVTPGEIKRIREGVPLEDIKTNRVSIFMEKYAEKLPLEKPKLLTIGWGEDKKKVKFSIEKVEEKLGKIIIYVRILKAGKVEGTNKMIVSPEGYIYPSPFSEDLEEGISEKIIREYRDFLSEDNTEFVFRHLNKN